MVHRLVHITVAGLLLAAAGSVSATAGTASCRVGTAYPDTAPATDIVCFTLDVGCADVVGALRVRSTDTMAYPTTVPGARWSLAFQVAEVRHEFVLTRSATGQDTAVMHVAGGPDVTPDFRVDATTVTWTVSRSTTDTLQSGGTITALTATATDALGRGWQRTAKTSPDDPRRTPSCD